VAIGDTLMSPEALAWARYGRLLIGLCVLGQPTSLAKHGLKCVTGGFQHWH
jgi:hypothetical protein